MTLIYCSRMYHKYTTIVLSGEIGLTVYTLTKIDIDKKIWFVDSVMVVKQKSSLDAN